MSHYRKLQEVLRRGGSQTRSVSCSCDTGGRGFFDCCNFDGVLRCVLRFPMNAAPADFPAVLSFFQISANSSKALDALSRVHALILLAIQDRRSAGLEQYLDDEEEFLNAYATLLKAQRSSLIELPFSQLLSEFVQLTLGNHSKLTVDSLQHVTLIHPSRVYDLFPFFLVKGNSPFWLQRFRTRTFFIYRCRRKPPRDGSLS